MNTKQYTIRNVPERVDQILKRKARQAGKSLNDIALEALLEGAGENRLHRIDMDFLVGSITPTEARLLEEVLTSQRSIDEKLWK